jgi:hypothetical protein
VKQVAKRAAAIFAAACMVGGLSARRAGAQNQAPPVSSSGHALNVAFKDLKWQKIVPELGDRSRPPRPEDFTPKANR